MDFFEFNKFAGTFLGTLLVVIVLAMVTDVLFEIEVPEHNAYGAFEGVAPAETEAEDATTVPTLAALLNAGSAADGARTIRKCTACHNLQKGEDNKIGPNLWGVLGSPRGGVEGFRYSLAFRDLGGDWGYAEIDAYLENPKAAVPGTKMGFGGVKDPADRANVILLLRENSDTVLPLPPS